MIARFRYGSILGVVGALLTFVLCCGAASAQFPGGMPGGMPGGPGGARPFDDALINAPIEALAYDLHLSNGQRVRIAKIQDDVHAAFARLMSPGGGPPDFGAMQANFAKIRKLDADGTAKIKALLTLAQRQALPATFKDIDTLNAVGIPPALIGSLNLTADEKLRLAAVAARGRKTTDEQFRQAHQSGDFGAMRDLFANGQRRVRAEAEKVLTARQRSLLVAYVAAHPQSPGGFGPFGGGPGPRRAAAVPPGIDLYVLVKKLNRIHARTPFSPREAAGLSDLLEPLFEQPELNPGEARALLVKVRALLTPEQVAALAAIRDITPESVQPSAPAGGFGGPSQGGPVFIGGPPPGGPQDGGPAPGGGPGGPPGGGPVAVKTLHVLPRPAGGGSGGPPGGGPGGPPGGPPGGGPGMNQGGYGPGFNPFYNAPGVAMAVQAGRELRELLDTLDGITQPAPVRPAAVTLDADSKIDVTTFHYNAARTGWNRNERVLAPRTVDAGRFGRLWHTPLDGQVYAAPLVVTGKHLGDNGRDVVIAPTENNTVYALDAETGAIVWQRHLATALSDTEYNDCINITPLHGITGTPVIDLDRNEIYVCGLTSSRLKQYYKVWALDLATGAVKDGWPVTLAGQYAGLTFDSGQLTQRGAMTLIDGWVYAPFASRCDIGEWHGWVMGLDTRHPTSAQRAFTSSPDTSGGGMWGSAGLAADSDGRLYAVTGNGDYNLNAGGKSIVESILRLTTRDGLGFTYQPTDYYVPANHEELDRVDADLGGSSAIVIDHPESSTPHLLVTGGKDGLIYLVDRDNLGGVGGEIQKDRLFGSGGGGFGSFIKTTPAYFEDGQGTRYIVVTGNDKGPGGTQGVVALKLGLDSQGRSHCTPTWTAGRPLYQPGTAVVSSNDGEGAIVWVIESNKNDDNGGPPGVLHAYDALTGKEIYRSSRKERRDALGDARKFSAPTVANGRVYCGTDGVVAYGPIEEDQNAP